MPTISQFDRLRKLKIRLKRWKLGRQFRHMAKVSRHLQITHSPSPTISWKGKFLCSPIPLNKLQNIHHRETTYIVASGPSIKRQNIKSLRDKFTFGVNGSILKFVESGISPSFYVISDEDFIYNRPQLLTSILENKHCHCFFTPQAISAICDINHFLLQGHPNITLFHNHFKVFGKVALEYPEIANLAQNDPEIITSDGRIGFSLNPSKGMFTAHTVPYFALQIAYGLGFREIYLIGLDLGSPKGETRFYEHGKTAMPSHLDRDYERAILPSFKIVGELCKQQLLQVYNLSPISRLPSSIIPKKNFDDVINTD